MTPVLTSKSWKLLVELASLFQTRVFPELYAAEIVAHGLAVRGGDLLVGTDAGLLAARAHEADATTERTVLPTITSKS